jgi:hypothetical protein
VSWRDQPFINRKNWLNRSTFYGKAKMMRNKRGLLGVGLGMAGSGALLAAIAMVVNDGYWLLLTGSVFLIIGLTLFIASLLVDEGN